MTDSTKSLGDRIAIVTGGGGGIGRGIALALAQAGATVVVADVDPSRCDEVATAIGAAGGRAMPIPTDVMDTEQVRSMVSAADREFGRIDVLVNNAGGVGRKPFLDQSERSWHRHIDLNLVSVLAATHAAVPVMIRGGEGGSIINVTSIESVRAAPNFAVYAACKAAVDSFSRSMALEFAEHGIRVNSLAPDHTFTAGIVGQTTGSGDPEAWTHLRSQESAAAMSRFIPLGREGHVRECGDAAVFLASSQSAYITGVVLPIDGGTRASSGWTRDEAGQWALWTRD